ncbi:MAG: WD40 repeat domain-containing protein [Mariniblastus sp.]|nr:WD40 repeat domain-containing protein [Mariniblastus sp.]
MTNRPLDWPFGLFSLLALGVASLLAGQEPPITDLTFAPDGQSLVACSQRGLHIYRWPDLELQQRVDVAADNLHAVRFSPDGNRLAVGGGNPAEEGSVEIFSWPDYRSLTKLSGHDDSVLAIEWAGPQQLVSVGLDRQVISWDLSRGEPQATLQGHSRGVSAIGILPDNQWVTAGHDRSVRVWNGKSGALVRTLNQHNGSVHALATCPATVNQPMIATAAEDRSIRFWQPTIGRMMRYIRLESVPLDVTWIDGSHLVAACADGQIRLVDTDQVTLMKTMPAIDGWAYAVARHPQDGTVVVGGSHGQLKSLSLPSEE